MKRISILFCFLASYILSLASNLFAQSGWSEDMRLSYIQGYSYDPKAACCGDTVHLVWWEGYTDSQIHEEVFYKRSTDAGETWGADVMLSIEDEQTSVLSSIAVNQNNIHVVWQQQDVGICYRKSNDGGNSWLPIDTIPNGGSGNPSICVADSSVYVVAYRTDGKIIFSKSTDNGNSWLPSQEINFGIANKPRIKNLNSSQSILVLSCENLAYSVEIYCTTSTDAGETWSDSQCVSQYDSISGQRPAMDTDDSSGIHITWYDYKFSPYPWTGDIFYRASRDSGNSWEEIDSLTVEHRAVASDILVENNNLHLVWEDDRHGFNNNFEIYYRMSTDLGQTWRNEVRLTDTLNWSRRPSLACDGQYLHLFWFDLRDDPSNIVGEIYYKRKDLSGSIAETNKSSVVANLKFDVYPNPFGTDIRLQITDDRYKEIKNIKIFDISGKEVMVYEMKQKEREIRVDCKYLPAGVYFLQIEVGKERVIKKVVKIE